MNKSNKTPSTTKKTVLGVEVEKTVAKPEKDLLKAKLVVFLNDFAYPTSWDKKHEKRFLDVLAGGLVSSQLTELSSLGYFLKRKNIKLLDAKKVEIDFSPIFEMSETLKDAEKIKKAGLVFGKAKQAFHTKFLADYGLVFASIARGVKEYGNVDGVHGDEGQQVLSFISLLVKQGYSFK